MKNELIDRYIYAVIKRLPANLKEDVSNELYGLIDDMLADRCGERMPQEKDIRIILEELGNPNELYEKYDVDGKKCLIGSPYFTTYKSVLKIVLICVIFGITLSSLILQITTPGLLWHENVFNWLFILWSGLVSGFAFVTLIFAVFYHRGISINTQFNLNDLPAVPNKKQSLSRRESLFEIGMQILFFVVFIATPQIFGVIVNSPTRIIPIFNVEIVRSTWYIISVFVVMGIVRESVKLIEGCYNKKVMFFSITTNLIAAISAFCWLANDKIMNAEFISSTSLLFGADGAFIANIFANFQYFFLGVMLFALALDSIDSVIKSK